MNPSKRARASEEQQKEKDASEATQQRNGQTEEGEESSGTESDEELAFYPGAGLESSDDEEEDEEDDNQGAAKSASGASAAAPAAVGSKRGRSDKDRGQTSQQDLVNVDFSFSDPQEAQFHSIKQFLTRYLPGMENSFSSSDLADAIVKQASVGTMITVDDDVDVYAFTTALNLHWHKDLEAIKQLRQYVLRRCPQDGSKQKLESLFNNEREAFGLLLNERMVNMPPEVAPHLLMNFLEDLKWAVENEISEEHRNKFKFRKLMLIAPCFKERNEDSEYYFRFEEELFDAIADISFSFSAGTTSMTKLDSTEDTNTTEVTVPQTRRVIVFDADYLPDIVEQVQGLVQQANESS